MTSRCAVGPHKGACALLIAATVCGCATTPKPVALSQAEAQQSNPQVQQAAQHAPQSFAHAQQLLERAEDAYSDGDAEAANILAQHGMAALQHTVVQGRIAQARARIASAQSDIDKTQETLAELAKQQQQLEASAQALELKVRVVRDAEPLQPAEPADSKREFARRVAARSIAEGARLLCLAVHMLDKDSETAKQTLAALETLSRKLPQAPSPTPITEAIQLRSACLGELTRIRRLSWIKQPETDPADVLLTQLNRALPELSPLRDDRGVVAASRSLFEPGSGGKLSPDGRKLLADAAAIAKAHPRFPLMVVVHGDPEYAARSVESVQRALAALKVDAVVHHAGRHLPARVGKVAGAPSGGSRAELVWVAP
jgi:hypothetical protein